MSFIEYPKCLYHRELAALTVHNASEEADAVDVGYLTAEQFHAPASEAPKKKKAKT